MPKWACTGFGMIPAKVATTEASIASASADGHNKPDRLSDGKDAVPRAAKHRFQRKVHYSRSMADIAPHGRCERRDRQYGREKK
jgi:pyruvate/2-oxoglutarate dehydrogenase complex dihydrolipoamide acyltransferase (E2) component